MSLSYPIAENAMQALEAPLGTERTAAMARRRTDRALTFQTEWLRPGHKEAERLKPFIDAAVATGAAQIYETEKGSPVIALNYWRIEPEKAKPKPKLEKKMPAAEDADHADDLYFRHGRTAKRLRKPNVNPNQLDLFKGPDQKGFEQVDPNNPNVVIADEGDGTAFGIAPSTDVDAQDASVKEKR